MLVNFDAMAVSIAPSEEEASLVARVFGLVGLEQRWDGFWYGCQNGKIVRIGRDAVESAVSLSGAIARN